MQVTRLTLCMLSFDVKQGPLVNPGRPKCMFNRYIFAKKYRGGYISNYIIRVILLLHVLRSMSIDDHTKVRVMVFNATFKNISVISWQSVLLVEETGVPRDNHGWVASHWQTLSHNVVYIEYTSPWTGFELTTLTVEKTGVPGENHWPAASHWQTLSYNVVSNTPRHEWDSNSKR